MSTPRWLVSTLRLIIPQSAKMPLRHLVMAMGIDLYMRTEARRVLETIIFPYFVKNPDYPRVLFVGCGWYTKPYNHVFAGSQYWTLDIDPERSRYGSSRHITDSLRNLDAHFDQSELDLIICTGVFGWGLNGRDEVEASFSKCHDALRDDGVFILGWTPDRRPFSPEEIESLRRFRPYVFPPLETSRYLTSGKFKHGEFRHAFDFFLK